MSMSEDDKKSPQAFLSYASEDIEEARRLFNGLRSRGVNVWFDKESLRPGPWKTQIERAIARSKYFVFCLSKAALRKIGDSPGFQDTELSHAYEIARAQDQQSFIILPVRFEDTDRGDHRLAIFQQFDLFEDWEKSVAHLARMIGGKVLAVDAISPDDHLATAFLSKVELLYSTGRLDAALAMIDAMEEIIGGKSLFSVNARGSVLHGIGRHEEAHALFTKALVTFPSSPTLWSNLGQVLTSMKRYREALTAVEKSLEIEDADRIRVRRAFLLLRTGRSDEGIAVYEAVLERDPNNYAAAIGLAIMLGTDSYKQYDKSLELALLAQRLKPDDRVSHETAGIALYFLNRSKEALPHLKKAIELGSKDETTHAALARICRANS